RLVQAMAQDLRAHCNTASAEGYNRIGIFGLPKNYSETELSVDSLALSVASKRVVLTYPAALQLYNPSVQQSTEVAGCYLAAALAGILSSLPVNTGLTRQVVSGFQGIDRKSTRLNSSHVKNSYAGRCLQKQQSARRH